jgi:hypothetical protein
VDVPELYLAYLPDLTGFRCLCTFWYQRFIITGSPISAWFRVPPVHEFIEFMEVCLRVYCHYAHSDVYAANFYKTESRPKIKRTIGEELLVPVYCLDLIREVARPMTSGSTTLLPYLPLDANGVGVIPGLGVTSKIGRYSQVLQSQNCEMVSLFEEVPGKSPIIISSDDNLVWINGSTLPTFRLLAQTELRSLRRNVKLFIRFDEMQRNAGTEDVGLLIERGLISQEAVIRNPLDGYGTLIDFNGRQWSIHELADRLKLRHVHMDPSIPISPNVPTQPALGGRMTLTDLEQICAVVFANEYQLQHADLETRAYFRVLSGCAFRHTFLSSPAWPSSQRFPSDEHPSPKPPAKPTSTVSQISSRREKRAKKPGPFRGKKAEKVVVTEKEQQITKF